MYVCDMPGRTFHRMSQMPDINILSLCYGSQDILWVGSDGQGAVSYTHLSTTCGTTLRSS